MNSPSTVIPRRTEVRATQYGGLQGLLLGRGVDPRPIFEKHDLCLTAFTDPDGCVDRRTVIELLEYCSRTLDDPLFGCRLAALQGPEIYGSIAAVFRYAPTLRAALNNKARYIPLFHAPELVSELVEGQETAEFRWRIDVDRETSLQAHLQAAYLNLKVIRGAVGDDFQPRYVQLTAGIPPSDIAPLEALFRCPVLPGAAVNAVGMPAHLLDHPIATHDRVLLSLIVDHLERVVRNRDDAIERRVETYIVRALPLGDCSISDCAGELGFASIRTLQERLLGRGHTFSDLVERVRQGQAEELLRGDHMPLEAIAAALGYSEQAAFGRAFKRWTGSSPQRYRRQRR